MPDLDPSGLHILCPSFLFHQTVTQTMNWNAGTAISGEPSAAPPRGASPATEHCRPTLLTVRSFFLRPGLDLTIIKSKPSDPDPRAHIVAYPFSLANFIKSPWVLLDSTRGPILFKTN